MTRQCDSQSNLHKTLVAQSNRRWHPPPVPEPSRPPDPCRGCIRRRADRIRICYAAVMDSLLTRITIDPAVCHGKPCVRGLRYPVETLLELLSSGMTHDEILADYEDMERDDLLAVLSYAARLARTRRLQPVHP